MGNEKGEKSLSSVKSKILCVRCLSPRQVRRREGEGQEVHTASDTPSMLVKFYCRNYRISCEKLAGEKQ